LVLQDRFAGVLDQRDKDLERAAAEPQRLSVLKKQPFRRIQPKRRKGEHRAIHRANRPQKVITARRERRLFA